MGFFSGISDFVGGVFGGGSSKSSNSTSTKNTTTVNPVTNVTNQIDLEPLAQTLAKSQEQTAKVLELQALSQKQSNEIKLFNDTQQREHERELEKDKLKEFSELFDQSKNMLMITALGAGLLYLYKKGK